MKFPSGPHSFGRLSGHIYGEGNGNPLQYSCLENPMDRGVWWATVYGVAKSQTTKTTKTHTYTHRAYLSLAFPAFLGS